MQLHLPSIFLPYRRIPQTFMELALLMLSKQVVVLISHSFIKNIIIAAQVGFKHA